MKPIITKPMLAEKAPLMSQLRYPLLATPKLDGIRCLILNGKALTRSFKPIPNDFIRDYLESRCPDGLDGEIIILGCDFNETAGTVARKEGKPTNFAYYVFDYVSDGLDEPYGSRMMKLKALELPDHCIKLLPDPIKNQAELHDFEEACLDEGFEGVMVRDPMGPYKCGRSTVSEGYLLKIKRFEDAEAEILECVEGLTNGNEAQRDAFGHTKRSTCQAGMIGRDTLGALKVRDTKTGCEFTVSGFPHNLAASIWRRRNQAVGRIIRYRFQPSGMKDAPRFPKFDGFRESWDF